MHKEPRQAKRKLARKDIEVRNKATSLHGLVGLELTALRKTFNGHTKYNFEKYLKDSIPECYPIEIINSERERERLKDLLVQVNDSEISENSFDALRKSIKGKYEINLIDHRPTISDTLTDQEFIRAHERLVKHEKKFSNEDKQKIANEVDNSLELLSVLGIELKRNNMKETLECLNVDEIELSEDQIFRLSQILGTITYIEDHTNTAEMMLKFKLTIKELRTFLLSYLRVRSLEGLLKKRVLDENFDVFDSSKNSVEGEPVSIKNESKNITNESKPRKKVKPKFKVKLKLFDLAKFKEIVENAPKLPPKKRGPYKKRIKKSDNLNNSDPLNVGKNQNSLSNGCMGLESNFEKKVLEEPKTTIGHSICN